MNPNDRVPAPYLELEVFHSVSPLDTEGNVRQEAVGASSGLMLRDHQPYSPQSLITQTWQYATKPLLR